MYIACNPYMVNLKFSPWVEKISRGKRKSQTKKKSLTGKEKVSQGNKRSRAERKSLTLKENYSQGKKSLMLKGNVSEQNKEKVTSISSKLL